MTYEMANPFFLIPGELIDRLVDVTVMLHLDQGNREELQRERRQLIEQARHMALIPAGEPTQDTNPQDHR